MKSNKAVVLLNDPSSGLWPPFPSRGKGNGVRGFTLIELLVVVLIIGVLAAVAVPQYQKAVLKSRYAGLMPIAKTVAQGEEVYYMEHDSYANDLTKLNIQVQNDPTKGAVSISTAGDRADGFDYVFADHTDLPGLAYIIYQDHSGQFPGAVMCEANDKLNPMATWLCKEGLNGEEMDGSLQGDDWKAYLLSGSRVGRFGTVADEIRKTCNQTEGCSATVDPQTGEVTTTQCDTASRSNTIITYSDDGTQTGYRKEVCRDPYGSYTYNYSFENCICTTPSTFRTGVYNQNNQLIETYQCSYDSRDCMTVKLNYFDDTTGKIKEKTTLQTAQCSVAWDGKDGTCPSFTAGGSESVIEYDESNRSIFSSQYSCDSKNTDGTCKSYKVSDDSYRNVTIYHGEGSTSYTSNKAICQSFVGTTCQNWKVQTYFKPEGGKSSLQATNYCATLDENTGGCPAN